MILGVQLVCDSSLFFQAFLHDLDHFLCHSLASPGILSTHYIAILREWLSLTAQRVVAAKFGDLN